MSLSPRRHHDRNDRTPRGTGARSRPRALLVGAIALLGVAGLAACEKPEPDGRDLAVSIHLLPHEVRVGDVVTARGVLSNLGTVPADRIHFRVGSTPNLEVSLSGAGIGTCTSTVGVIDCRLPEGEALDPGATAEFVVDVRATGLGDAAFAVLATSPASEPEPDAAPNGAFHEVVVEAPTPSDAAVVGITGVAPYEPEEPTAGTPYDVATSLAIRSGSVEDLVVTQTFPIGTQVHGTYGFAEGWDPDAGELVEFTAECVLAGRTVSCRFSGPIASSIALDRFWVTTGVTTPVAGTVEVGLDIVGSDPAGGGPPRSTTVDSFDVLPA